MYCLFSSSSLSLSHSLIAVPRHGAIPRFPFPPCKTPPGPTLGCLVAHAFCATGSHMSAIFSPLSRGREDSIPDQGCLEPPIVTLGYDGLWYVYYSVYVVELIGLFCGMHGKYVGIYLSIYICTLDALFSWFLPRAVRFEHESMSSEERYSPISFDTSNTVSLPQSRSMASTLVVPRGSRTGRPFPKPTIYQAR